MIDNIKLHYPSAYNLTDSDFERLIKQYEFIFKDAEYNQVMLNFAEHLKKEKYSPQPSDLLKINHKEPSGTPNAEETRKLVQEHENMMLEYKNDKPEELEMAKKKARERMETIMQKIIKERIKNG